MTSKTITLTGEETKVEYSSGANAWLRNDGTDVIYASASAEISPGADGVISIPAGQAAAVYGANGAVYLLGTGSVQLVGSDYAECPFRTSTSSGGSGGVDEVARAAVNLHVSNTEVHVTATERKLWDGKADKSDIPAIPESLPANGGNADKVGGYTASSLQKFVGNRNTVHDCNDCTETGWYLFNGCGGHSPLNNGTTNSGTYFVLMTWQYNSSYICQTAMHIHGASALLGRTYTRCCNNGVWTDWDYLTRSADISALEARIAVLEGK